MSVDFGGTAVSGQGCYEGVSLATHLNIVQLLDLAEKDKFVREVEKADFT